MKKNSDVYEIYKMVTDNRWRDIFSCLLRSKSEKEKYIWKDTPNEQKLENFIKITDKRIRAFKNLEARSKARSAEEGKKQAEQEAKKSAQRANLIEEISDLFATMVSSTDIDGELKKVILKDQRKIKQEIVKHVMEQHAFPGQVLNKVVEEIILNKDQVLRNGAISDELIESGIRSLSSQSTSLSDVNVSYGASAGMGRN